jgi:hypothetical protein
MQARLFSAGCSFTVIDQKKDSAAANACAHG